jgi:hypothetical protein
VARGATAASFRAAARKVESAGRKLGEKNISGLRRIGEEIMLDVKASRPGKGVPVDKGTLRGSGRVEGPKNDEVTLSFGGAAAPYALEQHENTALRHRVGESRYLVRGVDRWAANGASVKAALDELRRELERIARRNKAMPSFRAGQRRGLRMAAGFRGLG